MAYAPLRSSTSPSPPYALLCLLTPSPRLPTPPYALLCFLTSPYAPLRSPILPHALLRFPTLPSPPTTPPYAPLRSSTPRCAPLRSPKLPHAPLRSLFFIRSVLWDGTRSKHARKTDMLICLTPTCSTHAS